MRLILLHAHFCSVLHAEIVNVDLHRAYVYQLDTFYSFVCHQTRAMSAFTPQP